MENTHVKSNCFGKLQTAKKFIVLCYKNTAQSIRRHLKYVTNVKIKVTLIKVFRPVFYLNTGILYFNKVPLLKAPHCACVAVK